MSERPEPEQFRNAKRHVISEQTIYTWRKAGRPTRCHCPMRHISRKRRGNCKLA